MPNQITSSVDQPSEVVPDSVIQGTPVPAAAALDEPHLMDSCEQPFPESSSASFPVQDKDTTDLAHSSSMPEIPVLPNSDNALSFQSDPLCKVQTTPTYTGKRYPTRTTCGPPSYLKDYELN